ncbi:uncharacterized protein V6R79_008784 [Siganus canaliculatus]
MRGGGGASSRHEGPVFKESLGECLPRRLRSFHPDCLHWTGRPPSANSTDAHRTRHGAQHHFPPHSNVSAAPGAKRFIQREGSRRGPRMFTTGLLPLWEEARGRSPLAPPHLTDPPAMLPHVPLADRCAQTEPSPASSRPHRVWENLTVEALFVSSPQTVHLDMWKCG